MRWKAVIGLILVAASIAGMYLWETKYRDEFALEYVVVASRDIRAGEIADSSCFESVRMLPSSRLEGMLGYDDISKVYGKACISPVYKGEQVKAERFADPSELIPVDTRKTVIKTNWIQSCSRDLCAGDVVELYFLPAKEYAGSYTVTSVEEDRVEIRCLVEEYFIMYDRIESLEKNDPERQSLMIVIKE